MARIDRIKRKLDILEPHYCKVTDETYKHVNHTGEAIESHFKIQISTSILIGKSLLTQHKIINRLLADEFANGLHALSIDIL